VKGAPSVERRHLPCCADEILAGLCRDAVGHLDQAQKASDVRSLDRVGRQGMCPLEQHSSPPYVPALPGVLPRRGEALRPFVLVVCQCRGAFKGKRGGSEGASPSRSVGCALELLDDARIGGDARGGAMPGAPVRLAVSAEHARERAVGGLAFGQRRPVIEG
jgi:hypothetical protein